MNCKNCEYAIKHRNLQDNEWYTRCTYEEGECVKIDELKEQIKAMKTRIKEIIFLNDFVNNSPHQNLEKKVKALIEFYKEIKEK